MPTRERILFLSTGFDAASFPGVKNIKVVGRCDGPNNVGGLTSFLTCTRTPVGYWKVEERIDDGTKMPHGDDYHQATIAALVDTHRENCGGLISVEIITND